MADNVAQKFNFAKEIKEPEIINTYKKIWMTYLGTESANDFDEFVKCCANQQKPDGQPFDVNGETFNKELFKKIKEREKDLYQEIDNEARNSESIKQIIKKKVQKKIAECIAKGKTYNEEEIWEKETKKYVQGEFIKKVSHKAVGTWSRGGITEGLNAESSVTTISKDLLEKAKTGNIEMSGVSDYVASTYFSQAVLDGFLPYDTVVTAGFAVANGKNLQMGCGEGKTGVLVFAAMAKVKNNQQVFLTSSTEALAKDTFDGTVAKYEYMGINKDEHGQLSDEVVWISLTSIRYPKRDESGAIKKGQYNEIKLDNSMSPEQKKKLLKEAYSKKIVIADNATIMQHKMAGMIGECDPKYTSGRALLADEGDYALLDQYQSSQQTGKVYSEQETEQRTQYRMIARKVIMKLNEQLGKTYYNKDDSNQYVDFNQKGKQIVSQIINKMPNTINKQQMYNFVYEALVVDTVYKENRDFQVKDGKIISESRAAGAKIDLPQGIDQALHIKYGFEIPQEREVLKQTNIVQVYRELFGEKQQQYISGTLGVNSDSLATQEEMREYNVTENNTYNCPPRDENHRIARDKRLFKTRDDVRNAIIKSALQENANNRPVLIGCVSDSEVNEIIARLRAQNNVKKTKNEPTFRIIKYTAASEDEFQGLKSNPVAFEQKYGVKPDAYAAFSDYVKEEGGKPGVMIVGTSIIGRGTTIKQDDSVKEGEGIHVIINGLHETSSRNQIQYAARTARGSEPGSYDEFMCVDDILEVENSLPEGFPEIPKDGLTGDKVEMLYKSFYEKVDTRQSNVRNHINALNKQLSDAYSYIDSELGENHPNLVVVKAVVTQRATEIQNRACGNANQAKAQEYQLEMKAFTEMYIAQYKQQDPSEFNPSEWLKAKGYKQFAEDYFGYSDAEIANIVSRFKGMRETEVIDLLGAKDVSFEYIQKIINETFRENSVKEAPNQSSKGVE